ncbi:MAG: hypothetical protein ABIH21_02880 [Patescibacteria group bacterium]
MRPTNTFVVFSVLSLMFALSCTGTDDGGLSFGDDDSATTDDDVDDSTEAMCPGDEQCPCFGNGTCMSGLRCYSNVCVDPTATAPSSDSATGASCVGAEACRCYRNYTCNSDLTCLSDMCVVVPDDDDDDDTSDDDSSDDDADDDDDSVSPTCGTGGVYTAAITIHTSDGNSIPGMQLNGCISDSALSPQTCGGMSLRAHGVSTNQVTWHMSVTHNTVVRLNGSLYTDSSDVSGGEIVGSPNDWIAYSPSNPQLHGRVSVRVCATVYWLSNSDLFSFEDGSSAGVDFDNYIN